MASSFTDTMIRGIQHFWDVAAERMAPGTQEFWIAVCPVIGYWVVAGFYELLDHSNHPSIVRHRITRKQPGRDNPITRTQVFWRVILQQVIQTALGVISIVADPQQCTTNPSKDLAHSAVQFILGMFVMDAWQYWIHRWMHVSTFLYKHIHSTHHKLLIPYAMGALYNHPLEALLLDTLGAGLSMYTVGMGCSLATVFFTFSTIKTVCDHCNYRWPLNPLHDLFPNNAAYHDIHHDIRGIKRNYSQPYFTHWDHLCGTFLEPSQFHLTQTQLDARLGLAKPHTTTATTITESAGNGPASPAGSIGSPTANSVTDGSVPPDLLQELAGKATAAAVTTATPGVTTRSRARQAHGDSGK